MKIKNSIPLILAAALLSFAGCAKTEPNTVTVAVIGDSGNMYPGYLEGTQAAANAESGVDIEYTFYDYDGSYEEGAAIVDMLAKDDGVTAVIGAVDMDLNKTAAYVFNDAQKLFIVPFFLYDSVFDDNHYTTVFSMCNPAFDVGRILRSAAADTSAVRWAICASDREFERSEMNGFLQSGEGDAITVTDCVSISELEERFDEIYSRWETLGVEGVVMFAENTEGFELLKRLKSRSPQLICAGDTAFDDTDITDADAELTAAMNGFLMANEFILHIDTEDKLERLETLAAEYTEDTGEELDMWYIQGYNAVRMVADTAVRIGSTDPTAIAAALHENGYAGMLQSFSFDSHGKLAEYDNIYSVFDDKGYTYDVLIENGGE